MLFYDDKLKEKVEKCITSSPIYAPNDRISIGFSTSTPPAVLVHYYVSRLTEYDNGTCAVDFPRNEAGDPLHTGFELGFRGCDIWGALHVHPDHRGKGYGRQLVEIVENIAKSLDFRGVVINNPNKEFFEHFNYNFDKPGLNKRF